MRYLFSFLKLQGSERSLVVKRNAYLSFVLMILSNLVQLLFVPVVIDCINPLRYGIWLTITSFLSWFSLMDMGIGGGLRVRLNEALAINDLKKAKELISSAYFSLIGIVTIAIGVYLAVKPFLKWEKIFNAPVDMRQEIGSLMLYVVLFFFIRFILQLINPINVAYGLTALSTLNNFLGSFLSLVIIYFLSHKLNQSLFWVGFIYSASPLLVYLVVTMIFLNYHKEIIPSIFYFKFSALRSMMNLGILILFDHISVIVVVSSTNLLIAHITSPAEVTPYSITTRLFILFITIFEIAAKPLLPAFAEAYFQGDMRWIKNVMKKMNYITIASVVAVCATIIIAKPFIHFWLKGKVEVSWTLVILIAIYTIVRLLWNVYSKFLGGIGVIKQTVVLTIIGTVIYVPLVLLMGKFFKLGIVGLLIVQIALSLPNVFYLPWLYRKLMKKREMELLHSSGY